MPGWSSSAWYIVGTPGSEVGLVRSIAASAWPASKRGSITISPPSSTVRLSTQVLAKTWNKRQHAEDPVVGRAGCGIERVDLPRIGA